MKHIKYLMMAVAALTFASCETDVEQPQLSPESEFVAPVLNPQSDVVINAGNSKSETVTFTCSDADFGLNVAVRYELYAVLGDKEARLVTSYYPTMSILKNDLNGVVINSLGVAPNESAEIGAYVVAYAGDSQTVRTEKSNTVTFSVSTFKAAMRCYFLVGALNNWSEKTAMTIWETAGGSNIYEGIYDFIEPSYEADGSDFQFLPTLGTWDGQLGYAAFSAFGDGFSEREGNIMLPVGIHKITADMNTMSLDAKTYSQIDIMGSFDGWAEPLVMTYDPAENVWRTPAPISGGDEFKIRFNDSWDINYGDGTEAAERMELDPEGFEAYQLVQGGGNIKVPGSGSYIVKLHADRTPFAVSYEQQ